MSKRRPKTSLVNLLRNKKTAIAAAVCVVVAMGAYVGVTSLLPAKSLQKNMKK